jgi:hypothetical protein
MSPSVDRCGQLAILIVFLLLRRSYRRQTVDCRVFYVLSSEAT